MASFILGLDENVPLVRLLLPINRSCPHPNFAHATAMDVCLKMPSHGPIDLSVTDVIMPKMSGRQLADTLSPCYPRMGTLFVSGYAADIVEEHGVQGSHVDFLQESITPSVL